MTIFLMKLRTIIIITTRKCASKLVSERETYCQDHDVPRTGYNNGFEVTEGKGKGMKSFHGTCFEFAQSTLTSCLENVYFTNAHWKIQKEIKKSVKIWSRFCNFLSNCILNPSLFKQLYTI